MHIVILPVLVPFFAGICVLFSKYLNKRSQQAISLLALGVLVFVNILALGAVVKNGTYIYQLGDWQAPFGISLVLDQLSAMMLLVTSLLALGALVYAINSKIDIRGSHFHVLFQMQLFGLNGAFLTGDVFNLFVFFEVLLIASYGLLLHGNGKERTKYGLHYVVLNLIGSSLFLFAVGTLYGILGTLNIADMALKVSQLSPENINVVAGAGLLLLLVFGLKAAMFPLYFWLPNAYASTSAPVASLFAIMTKVGIYSIIRVHGTIFGSGAGELNGYYLEWVLWLGMITMVLGTIGVMSSKKLSQQVAYLVLTSVATILIGIGSKVALGGTLYYMIHSTFVAGGFFLLVDVIAKARPGYYDSLIKSPSFRGIVLVGSIYFAYAVAVAGMPPLSGFFGKMMILQQAMANPYYGVIFAVVLICGLFVIISLVRSGVTLFYDLDYTKQMENSLVKKDFISVIYFMILLVSLVLFADPISNYTTSTALMLQDSSKYIIEVLR